MVPARPFFIGSQVESCPELQWSSSRQRKTRLHSLADGDTARPRLRGFS